MKTSSLFLLGAIAATAACSSEVTGGGGGAGGAGDGGATTAPATTTDAASSGETAAVGTTGPGGTGGDDTTTATSGGGGSENLLGECELDSGTSGSSGSGGGAGTFECDVTYTCDAGTVEVSCVDDGTTETCSCSLSSGGSSEGGDCVNTASNGCSFPQNCCFELLGGHAEPNLGPYGACEEDGSGSGSTSGGTTACSTGYTCDGGDMTIDCEGDETGATCECRDDQFFLIGTCRQSDVDCDYDTGCCYDVFNP